MLTSLAVESESKALHIGLWVAQALLGAAFLMAGGMKLLTPIDQLMANMPWVASVGQFVRFIGAAELAGALGLILPSALRIQPRLTVWAALGLVTVMVLAMATHVMRGEFNVLPINLVLGGVATFIAWGRSKRAPIAPR